MGMEIRVRQDRRTGLYYIKTLKGVSPPSLSGSFMKLKEAERTLIKYLKKKERVLFPATYPTDLGR